MSDRNNDNDNDNGSGFDPDQIDEFLDELEAEADTHNAGHAGHDHARFIGPPLGPDADGTDTGQWNFEIGYSPIVGYEIKVIGVHTTQSVVCSAEDMFTLVTALVESLSQTGELEGLAESLDIDLEGDRDGAPDPDPETNPAREPEPDHEPDRDSDHEGSDGDDSGSGGTVIDIDGADNGE